MSRAQVIGQDQQRWRIFVELDDNGAPRNAERGIENYAPSKLLICRVASLNDRESLSKIISERNIPNKISICGCNEMTIDLKCGGADKI